MIVYYLIYVSVHKKKRELSIKSSAINDLILDKFIENCLEGKWPINKHSWVQILHEMNLIFPRF